MPTKSPAMHTPTPWKLGYSDGSGPHWIVGQGEMPVATIGFHGDPEIRGEMIENERADAALIVLAVNSHAELVAALEDAATLLDGPIGDRLTGDEMAELGVYDALETIRAALAKAGR